MKECHDGTHGQMSFVKRHGILQHILFGLTSTAMHDRVVHLPILDQTFPARDTIISSCNVVRGRLRPARLRESLDELVSRWPILTSRVEANPRVCLFSLGQS